MQVRALLFVLAFASTVRADLNVPAVEGRQASDRCRAVFDDLRKNLETRSAEVQAIRRVDSIQLIVIPPKWDGAPEFRAGASFGTTPIRTFVSPPQYENPGTSSALRDVYLARRQCAGEALIQYGEDFMDGPVFTLPDGWRVVRDRFVDERGQQRLRRIFPPDAPSYPESEYDWIRRQIIGRWLVTYGMRRGEFRVHLTTPDAKGVGVLFYGTARTSAEADVLVKLVRAVQ
jgi:hypothetical protein